MRAGPAHLTAEGTRDGRAIKLSHPLHAGTLDEARAIYKTFALLLPAAVVWRTDLPPRDPDPAPDYGPATHDKPQEGPR